MSTRATRTLDGVALLDITPSGWFDAKKRGPISQQVDQAAKAVLLRTPRPLSVVISYDRVEMLIENPSEEQRQRTAADLDTQLPWDVER